MLRLNSDGSDFCKAEAIMRIRNRLIERYPNTNFKSLRLNPISYELSNVFADVG